MARIGILWLRKQGGKVRGMNRIGFGLLPSLGALREDRSSFWSCTSDRTRETHVVLIGGPISIRAGQLITSFFHFCVGGSCSLDVAYITLITTTPQRRTRTHWSLLSLNCWERNSWGLGLGGISPEATMPWSGGREGRTVCLLFTVWSCSNEYLFLPLELSSLSLLCVGC